MDNRYLIYGLLAAVIVIGVLITVSVLVYKNNKKKTIDENIKQIGMAMNLMETPSKIIKDPETGKIFNEKASGLYSAKKVEVGATPLVPNTLVKGIGYSDSQKTNMEFDLNLVASTPSAYEFENDPEYIDKVNCLDIDEIRLYYYKRVPYDLTRTNDGSQMFKKDNVTRTCYAYAERISKEPAYVQNFVIVSGYAPDPLSEDLNSQIHVQFKLYLKDASMEGEKIRLDFSIPGDNYDAILRYNELQLQYAGAKLFYAD